LNNFVANTTSFFNAFSETVEKRISGVSNKITELETLLAVLEAKLNSVPDLDAGPVSTASQPTQQADTPSAAPAPTSNVAIPDQTSAVTATAAAPAATMDANMCPVSEHPDYVPFFKLLKVGVPPFVVQAKVTAAGLDASMIDTPDKLVPK
jgi:hypothetical protein